ncbi:MAG: U32 family peptidase [Clostridiales bacterium]|nr:U32 family peptidase [Clostridiales bacterium]
MTKPVEILAPAGSFDALVAAVRCGADAVYLGAGDFNARRNADNFTEKELKEAINYCHVRNVKVYLTLNTLVFDAEVSAALELLSCVCALGADALIVQDLGLARLIREVAPDMPLHASTQMSVMNIEGLRQLEELGFKRAVLPRELSFEEIKELKENTTLELEVFVHGALCMCVSGQCYLSGMLGGRSGNRGLCAQPCRLPFEAPGGTGFDLSLKDLSLIEHLPELTKLGIDSFKIEGRMKRPEYVAAAVSACRATIDRVTKDRRDSDLVDYSGIETKNEARLKEQLRAVFSRSGFTDGYYTEKTGRSMFGTRRHEDVTAAAPVLKELARLYEREPQTIPISFSLTAELHKPLLASASTGKTNTFVTSSYKVQRAQSHATDVSKIRDQLHKTGGTPFKVQATDIKVDEDVNIPLSEINSIRRLALENLEKKLAEGHEKQTFFSEYKISIADYTKTGLLELGTHSVAWMKKEPDATRPNAIARFASADQIPADFSEFTKGPGYRVTSIIIPLFTTEDKYSRIKKLGIPYGVEMPRALFGPQREIRKKLKEAKSRGAAFAYCGTLDAVMLAKRAGLRVMGAQTLNICNSFALAEYEDLGLHSTVISTELEIAKISALRTPVPRGIVSYGQIPLMLVRNCPIKNGRNCRSCGSRLCLTDRKGIRFPVTCEANGGRASEVLNSRPVWLADRQADLKSIDFQLLYFSVEPPEKVSAVLSAFRDQDEPEGEFTRGLYYRGVE